MSLRFFGSLVATALVVAACSSPSSGAASTNCNADSDCSSGLSCLSLSTFSPDGGGCSEGSQKACSKTCAGDGDCASLGAGFLCLASCGGAPMTCGATR